MKYKNIYILLICIGVIGIVYYYFPKGLQINGESNENTNLYSTGTLNPQNTNDVLGCMDVMADNYDSSVTIDNGSCLTAGCMDIEATNYNPDANFDPNNTLCNYGNS